MAYINKSSLRTEFDALKQQFEELSSAGKVTPESGALFKALLMLFELMVAVFLEKTTKKDSKNSSLPSSQVDIVSGRQKGCCDVKNQPVK